MLSPTHEKAANSMTAFPSDYFRRYYQLVLVIQLCFNQPPITLFLSIADRFELIILFYLWKV